MPERASSDLSPGSPRTTISVANGRRCRAYFFDHDSDPVCVTYWKVRGGRIRQMTISEKLMGQVLRTNRP